MGDRMSYFSNYGELLDVFALGSDIVSATADNDNSLASWSGTSMAAPHVQVWLPLSERIKKPLRMKAEKPRRVHKDSIRFQGNSTNKLLFSSSTKPVKIPNQKNQRSHNPKTQKCQIPRILKLQILKTHYQKSLKNQSWNPSWTPTKES